MTQTARPVIDITRVNWVKGAGAANPTVNLFEEIDEATRNDSEYIETILDPATAVYVVRFSSVTDPQVATGHVIEYAFRKDADAGDVIDFTLQLRRGYVSEASLGTLIYETLHAAVAGTAWITGAITLTAPQVALITPAGYGDLFVRLIGNSP